MAIQRAKFEKRHGDPFVVLNSSLDIFFDGNQNNPGSKTHTQNLSSVKILIGTRESKVKFFRQWPLIVSSQKSSLKLCAAYCSVALIRRNSVFCGNFTTRIRYDEHREHPSTGKAPYLFILEMLDMACESYEVCRKEPFGISIAAFELLTA